jgi:WD40 repeat protein
VSDLAGKGVRVLLVGTDSHDGPGLPSVPAVGRTVRALRDRLVDRCGVPAGQLRVVHNPPDALAIATAVTEEVAKASTVLLIYYVGHGLWGPGGEVYLAARGTDTLTPGLAAHQAYPLSELRQALSTCRASSVVVVLDCCFSGRARLGMPADGRVFELPSVHGVYLLGSAEQLALADPEQEHTAFSGELITLLDQGDPDAGPALTLDDAYHYLFQALLAKKAPRPHRQEAGRSGQLVLAANAAYEAGPVEAGKLVEQAPGPSPYRSLAPFREEDADFFCGRESLAAELLAAAAHRLTDPRPLLVLGPSGSGKSSLLRAGLLAGVRRDGLGGSDSIAWPRIVPVVTPREHPVRELAGRLAPDDPTAAQRLIAEPETAAQLVDALLADRPGQPLLLVVDQLEELFTLCSDDDERERTAFVRALTAIAAPRPDATVRAVVVAALRADFYGQAIAYPELAGLVRGPQVLVGPMTREQLRLAIERPAERAGLELGDGLAELLLHELGAFRPQGPEPGSLPLLSHVLWETWRKREGKRLTVRGYRASGAIGGAIAKTADGMYRDLDEAGQQAVRGVLLRLVRVGDGTPDTARPVDRGELLPGMDSGPTERALQALAAARLVTVDRDVVRVSHEALLHSWPRLHAWINDDRAALVVRQQLADAVQAWLHGGRDRGDLYGRKRLANVRTTVAQSPGGAIAPLEREFLAASAREVRTRQVQVGLAAVLVVLLGVGGVVAFQQRARADQQRARAELLDARIASRQIAAQADAMRPTDPGTALQLSLAAYRTAATPEARDSLYASYATAYPTSLVGHGKAVVNLAYTPDGRTLVSSSADHTIRLWDLSNTHPATRATLPRSATSAIAVGPDGRLLAGHTPDALTMWDISDPNRPVELSTVATDRAVTTSVAFRADGRVLATGGDHGTVRLWDVSDPRRPVLLATTVIDTNRVGSVSFSRDGRTLATASPGVGFGASTVRLWDVNDARHPAALTALAVDAADAVAFSPVGDVLAAGGAQGVLNVWDVANLRHPVAKENKSVHESGQVGNIFSLAFRPDGQAIATSSTTGEVNIWGVKDKVDLVTALPGAGSGRSVAFRPDGQSLAIGADGGEVRVWATPARLLAGVLSSPGSGVPGTAYGQDGRLLVTSSGADIGSGGGARLWDIGNPARPVLAAQLPQSWPVAVFLRGGRTLISQDKDGAAVRLWDVTDAHHPVGGATFTRSGSDKGYVNVAASPDGHGVAVGNGAENSVRLWDIHDARRPVETATITTGEPAQHLWFLDKQLLAVWGKSDIQLWDLSDPAHPAMSGALTDAVDGVVLYLRSRHVAITGQTVTETNGSVGQLWDLSDPRRPQRAGTVPIRRVYDDLIPTDDDNRTLAVIAARGAVEFWDIADVHAPTIRSALNTDLLVGKLDISPDSQLLAGTSTSSFAETMHVWRRDSSDHGAFTIFTTMPGRSPEFGPDSRTVAVNLPAGTGRVGAFASGGAVVLWDLDPDRLYQQMCAVPPNSLTTAGWKRYFPALPYRGPCR